MKSASEEIETGKRKMTELKLDTTQGIQEIFTKVVALQNNHNSTGIKMNELDSEIKQNQEANKTDLHNLKNKQDRMSIKMAESEQKQRQLDVEYVNKFKQLEK